VSEIAIGTIRQPVRRLPITAADDGHVGPVTTVTLETSREEEDRMKINREGFLAAVSAFGLLLPTLAACDAAEDEGADGGLGGAAAGGEASGGATGGSAAGGEAAGGEAAGGATGGSAAGGEAEGGSGGGGGEAAGGSGGAGGSDPCVEDARIVVAFGTAAEDPVVSGEVVCGASSYFLGLAETASGGAGWYGEDCLEGEKNGFDICHPFSTVEGFANFSLAHVDSPDMIVPGESTLFTTALAEGITWVIINVDDPSRCWVGGHDVTYYDELGCQNRNP
jgi:hypothetical protein